MITGETLLALGYKPGKWFKQAIACANSNELAGKSLTDYLESVCPKVIAPLTEPADFFQKVRYENGDP